jgi:hypothetical protein
MLSKDMSQRCIHIMMKRPKFNKDWEDNVRQYIDQYRWEILADIRYLLELPSDGITTRTRWSAWEAAVLSKTTCYEECQSTILQRQQEIDIDEDERQVIIEYLTTKLIELRHDPDTERLHIPSATAAEWIALVRGSRLETNKVSAFLNGLGIPTLKKCTDTSKRGWVWTGPKADPNSKIHELNTPLFIKL